MRERERERWRRGPLNFADAPKRYDKREGRERQNEGNQFSGPGAEMRKKVAQLAPRMEVRSRGKRTNGNGPCFPVCTQTNVQYSAKRWRLGCVIPRPSPLWPQGRVHAT